MSLWSLVKEMFPGKPRWTAADMPDLSGKVVLVTGGNTGIGWETCKALLEHNAKVYLCARNEQKTLPAIEKLKNVTGKDSIHFIKLDLGDLPSCARAAKEFAAKEPKLDILFLNAGVMTPPLGSKTASGYDMQWGTNVVGHFVFTKLLFPSLKAAAKTGVPDATRVVWTSSNGHILAPKGFVNFEDVNLPKAANFTKYGQSKAGNIILATWMAHHLADDGILTFSLNPGAIKTELQRNTSSFVNLILGFFLHPPSMGAITQLYAGTSPELTKADNGRYFGPWAKEGMARPGVQDPALADKLWNYLEEDTAGKY